MINPQCPNKLIQGILESPVESRTIELKPSIKWPKDKSELLANNKAQEIIKCILGLSNSKDGGKIILGIEKNNSTQIYELRGMNNQHIDSFDHDLIFNQVKLFGMPEPKFQTLNINC